MSLKTLQLPPSHNYIACFLTLECNLNCDYCINSFGRKDRERLNTLSGEQWVAMLNRLQPRADIPVTLQGGEPSLHPDFLWIISHLKNDLAIDILTNLSFDVDAFAAQIPPQRLRRNAPYPSIRVSYHPYYMDLDELTRNVLKLQRLGFSIGIFSILHPGLTDEVMRAQQKCRLLGIDFRTKEFLGEHQGRLYGTYRYPGAVGGSRRRQCLCRTTELLVSPEGKVYRCHHDLYHGFPEVGSMLDPDFVIEDVFRDCDAFGSCNPCDIKVKTDRFQVFGHTSVEVRDIR